MGGVAVEGAVAVVALEGDLPRRGREGGGSLFAAAVVVRGGEFCGAGVEADARDEEAMGVEAVAVFGTPDVDERGGEVAGGGVGDGKDGGLEVVVFEDVVLEEGHGLFREAGEWEAFDVAVVDAFGGESRDVGCEVRVREVHKGDADAVVEGEAGFGEDGGPRAGANVGKDGKCVDVGGGEGGCYGRDC